MSWEDIVKRSPRVLYEYVINNLEKKVYKKYKGDDATRNALSLRGKKFYEQTRIFVAVSKRLDKIAKNPTEEDLIDFMTQYLDFSSASAKRYIDKNQGF